MNRRVGAAVALCGVTQAMFPWRRRVDEATDASSWRGGSRALREHQAASGMPTADHAAEGCQQGGADASNVLRVFTLR